MPVYLDGKAANHPLSARAAGFLATAPSLSRIDDRALHIGLINNMPDAALQATERQFLALLNSAAGDIRVHLSLYALPEVPRSPDGQHHIDRYYSNIDDLLNKGLDGVIVTGREPRTENLKAEPYWPSVTQVLEWAKENTYSTIWSCLAAHAAVLHLDGLERSKSRQKHCGVFQCVRIADHPMMVGVSDCLDMPHSRWNGVAESELTDCGYGVLTRAIDAGVDSFVKQYGESLFVFFQGHPEYEADTLRLEYRRDVGRYLKGESVQYPSTPWTYFHHDTVEALAALREKALAGYRNGLMTQVDLTLGAKPIENTWQSTASRVYRNWLTHICSQRERRLKRGMVVELYPAAQIA